MRTFKTPKEIADFFSMYDEGFDKKVFRKMLLEAIKQVIDDSQNPKGG